MALVLQGRAHLSRGEIKAGLARLAEAMVAVTNDELWNMRSRTSRS
jgi:hypothetical protein